MAWALNDKVDSLYRKQIVNFTIKKPKQLIFFTKKPQMGNNIKKWGYEKQKVRTTQNNKKNKTS